MESGTSDQTISPNLDNDENTILSDLSIQASLQRISSIVSENITSKDDLSIQMESPISKALSKNLEIIEVDDDSSSRMGLSLQTTSSLHDLVEAEEGSKIGSTSSPNLKVNPFIEDLLRVNYTKDAFEEYFSILNQKLKDGLQKEAVYAFLKDNNMMEGQKKVQELFNLIEAMEFMDFGISNRATRIPQIDPRLPNFKADYHRSDIYYHLLNHALDYATNLQSCPSIGLTHSDSMIVANMSEYFKAVDFMIFLINKLQEEGDITSLSFKLQGIKTSINTFVQRFEEETISTFICLVVNDEDGEAIYLFERLLKHMKPNDIINCGRVYNYALQNVQELDKVHTFLSSPNLCERYKNFVQKNNRMMWFATEYNQVKVHKFLVDLYLRDVDLKQKIDWEFVEQYDYPYLIHCVWECHKKRMVLNNTKYEWTPLQQNYVITSSASITFGSIDVINYLLEDCPKLINASYKGVTALHAAVCKENEEVITCLLKYNELDINVRTRRLLTRDDVNKFLKHWKLALHDITFSKGVIQYKNVSPSFAILLKDHEELIKDLLFQQEIQLNKDGRLDVNEFLKKTSSSGKKWNINRWKLPTYQTALHIATTKRHAKVVKLICDVREPHQVRLRCHEEDEEDQTPLDILYGRQNEEVEDFDFLEIKKILLSKQDVQLGIDRLYRNRQVLVDAVNTILVGAALIAGVTFAGWLQPPLGYVQFFDLTTPYPTPPSTYDSYLAIQGNLGVKAFALFNSLSFFFAIATVIVGADAAFPTQRYQYIGHVVETMHFLLRRAVKFLIISLVCVLGAFGSAAVVVLPPSLFFRKDLVLSIIIGGGVCSYALWQLLSRHSTQVQRLNASIRHIIKFTNVL